MKFFSHHNSDTCNHHHFPQQNQWLLGCLKLTPGTDKIGDPRNLLRYPANLTQASRVVFSGVRGLEAVARKAKENKEANHQNCDGYRRSHESGLGHIHDCGGHSHGNGHEYQHLSDCCEAKQEYQEPTNLQHFKEQVQSFANPNLHNGNEYLSRLNGKLFGKGSEDCKLTLQGIKELAKQIADNKTSLVSEIAELITTTNTAEARKDETVPPPPQVVEEKRQRRQQGAGAGNGERINLVVSYSGDSKYNHENCTEHPHNTVPETKQGVRSKRGGATTNTKKPFFFGMPTKSSRLLQMIKFTFF